MPPVRTPSRIAPVVVQREGSRGDERAVLAPGDRTLRVGVQGADLLAGVDVADGDRGVGGRHRHPRAVRRERHGHRASLSVSISTTSEVSATDHRRTTPSAPTPATVSPSGETARSRKPTARRVLDDRCRVGLDGRLLFPGGRVDSSTRLTDSPSTLSVASVSPVGLHATTDPPAQVSVSAPSVVFQTQIRPSHCTAMREPSGLRAAESGLAKAPGTCTRSPVSLPPSSSGVVSEEHPRRVSASRALARMAGETFMQAPWGTPGRSRRTTPRCRPRTRGGPGTGRRRRRVPGPTRRDAARAARRTRH